MRSDPDPTRRRLLCAVAATPLAACASHPATGDFNADALAEAMDRQPVVLLGEIHDNPVQHRVRALALQRLIERGARPAIAFEQFDRDQQAGIDAARRDADAVSRSSQLASRLIEQFGRGGWDWPLYRPFVELALTHELPIVAANLSRADAMKVGRAADFDALFDQAIQQRLGLDRLPAEYLNAHEREVDAGHCNSMPSGLLPALARAQIARDAALLLSIRPHLGRRVVLLTGNGHARKDIGIPFLMNDDERARTVSIGLLEAPAPGDADDDTAALAHRMFDVAFVTPRHERPDPCESLRRRDTR